MNKVIWLINPATFRDDQMEFPATLAKNGNHRLVAVLLNEWQPAYVPVLTNDPVFPTTNYSIPEIEVDENALKAEEDARKRIIDAAAKAGVDLSLHNGPVEGDDGIIEESRFADLVLVGAGLSFHVPNDETPSKYVMELLPKLQCPVLVMPDDHQEVREIYFAYNGGYSSMYAIRQMIYLFPEFKRLPVTVIYVEEGRDSIPFEKSLKSFLYNHFENITFRLLKGEPSSALTDELMHKKNALVTLGAFGRSKASRFFRHSNAEGVLQVIDIPVFITHP